MKFPIYIIDSFTTSGFGGNPAAVCLVEEELSDETCLRIAAEMNLSETAFVTRVPGLEGGWAKGGEFGLRWWTPTKEVPLCGHATLAAAHVLFRLCGNASASVAFRSRFSGRLAAKLLPDGAIQLDFPRKRTAPLDLSTNPVAKAMAKAAVGDAPIEAAAFADEAGFANLLIELPSMTREDFEAVAVSAEAVLKADPSGKAIRLLTLTTKAPNGDVFDFYDRVIAPFYRIPEDPVTGSAHSPLADYWAQRLGKTELRARQCSKRGGDLQLKVDGERVFIAGHSVRFLTGTINF